MTKKTAAQCSSLVPYLRTSTDDQKLGIEAQQETTARIARDRRFAIARTFIEHESGGDNDRPELVKAMHHARRVGAALLVAKLDRLSRDATFLMTLYDGNVPIIFGDMPEIDGSAASRFMVQSMANVAEFERRRIGERTREALQALKARGVKLGTPANLTAEARARGVQVASARRTARAIAEMSDVAPIIRKLRMDGGTLQAIADHLNAEGYVARQGSAWSTTQVLRILRRSKGNA